MKKKFLVIGVGRFGQAVIKGLHQEGHHVVACDRDESCLDSVYPFIQHSLVGDTSDERFYKDVDVTEFDTVVVSIGEDVRSCLLTVGLLKENGARKVISKAGKDTDGRLLRKLGADDVILPEADSGFRLSKQLSNPGLLEAIELSPHCSGLEVKIPYSFIGKSLFHLDIRKKFNLTVVMLTKKGERHPVIPPSPLYEFEENDIIFIVGENSDLQKFSNKFLLK